MNIVFDPIEEVLEEIRQGRLVIVTDDANRENEGDLILAAEKATPELINFMIRYTSGVICVPMEGKDLDRLELPLMTVRNTESMRTAYTISADAKEGVTTGISAADRSRTIRLLAEPGTKAQDLVRPGHVFPLRYREGGVLRRAGHTEAAVDLARLAGLSPAGVLAEVVNDDGSMARLPELIEFKRQHHLKICSIENLIAYRRAREVLIERLEIVSMPTDYGDFRLHLYRSVIDDVHHLALVKGDDLSRRTNARPRPQRVPDRRCFRFASVRLWRSIARRLAAHQRSGFWRTGLYAPGRTRDRTCRQDPRLSTSGTGPRHGRSQRKARLSDGSP